MTSNELERVRSQTYAWTHVRVDSGPLMMFSACERGRMTSSELERVRSQTYAWTHVRVGVRSFDECSLPVREDT